MRNAELIRRVKAAPVNPADCREYARRVSRRVHADYCEHKHFGCALVPNGPCMDEALAMSEWLEAKAQESMARCEADAAFRRDA